MIRTFRGKSKTTSNIVISFLAFSFAIVGNINSMWEMWIQHRQRRFASTKMAKMQTTNSNDAEFCCFLLSMHCFATFSTVYAKIFLQWYRKFSFGLQFTPFLSLFCLLPWTHEQFNKIIFHIFVCRCQWAKMFACRISLSSEKKKKNKENWTREWEIKHTKIESNDDGNIINDVWCFQLN